MSPHAGRARVVASTRGSRLGLAASGAARNPGRSILSVTLVACATFVIVAVAANRRQYGDEVFAKENIRPAEGVTLELARAANGGMRDALSSMDQIIACEGPSS